MELRQEGLKLPASQEKTNRYSNLALASVGHFVNDGTLFFFPLLVDIFATYRGFFPLELSAMFAAFYVTSSIATVLIGRLADKTGRYGELMTVGIFFVSAGLVSFFYTLAYSPPSDLLPMAIFSSFVSGFGSAFYHPLGAAIIQNSFDGRTRGKALGVNGAMGSLGRAIYFPLFFSIAIVITQNGSILLFSIVGFVASFLIYTGFRKQRIRMVSKKEENHAQPIREIMTKGIVFLTAVTLVRNIATQGIVGWFPTYLTNVRGIPIAASLGTVMAIIYSSAIIGQPVFGILTDRFDKRFVLAFSTLGSSLSLLGYILSTGFISVLFLPLFGFFTFSGFPMLLSLVSEYVPKGVSSLGNAVVWGGSSIGMAIGPTLIGTMMFSDYSRMNYIFEVMAIVILIVSIATVFLPKPPRKSKMPLFG